MFKPQPPPHNTSYYTYLVDVKKKFIIIIIKKYFDVYKVNVYYINSTCHITIKKSIGT